MHDKYDYYGRTNPRKKRQSSISLCLAIFGIFSMLLAAVWIWIAVKSPTIGWEGYWPVVTADPKTFSGCQTSKHCYDFVAERLERQRKDSNDSIANYRKSKVEAQIAVNFYIPFWVFRYTAISLAVLTIFGGILLIVGVGFPNMCLYATYVIVGIIQVLLLLILIALCSIVIVGIKGRIDDEHSNKLVLVIDGSEFELIRFTWMQLQIMKEFQDMYEFSWIMDKVDKAEPEDFGQKEMTPGQFKKEVNKIQTKFDILTNIIMGISISVIVICVIYLLLQIAVNLQTSMSKKLRLAGFKDYPPLVQFSKCPTWNMKTCLHPGSDVEFLRVALKIAGFDYEVIQHNYLTTNEIISALHNGSADMSLIAIRVKEERLNEIQYTSPINYLQFGYLAKELDKLESDDFLTLTFHFEIYFVLLASIFVVALIFRLEFSFTHRNYWDFLWYVFGTFFNQDKRIVSNIRSTAIRILTISWIYFSWIIINYYQAGLKYYLTVPLRHGVAFRDLQQVLDAMEYHGWIGVQNVNGYGPELYCTPLQCEQIHRLRETGRIIMTPRNDDSRLIAELSNSFHVGFTAFSVDLAPNDISIYDERETWPKTPKKLLFIKDMKLSYEMLAFAVNPNLTYELEQINRALSKIISSYAVIRGRYIHPYPPYTGSLDSREIVLTMVHLQAVYLGFLVLCIIGALVLFGEIAHHRSKWRIYSVDERENGEWTYRIDLGLAKNRVSDWFKQFIRIFQ